MNGCRRTVSIVRHTEGVNITALLPLVLLAADEEVGGVQRFLTRPVIAVVIIVGCFILTRITYAILRIVVRKVADSKPGRGKGWWKNTMRRVGAETLEGGENRRRQRIEAATGMLHQLTSFVLWIIAVIAVFNVLNLDAAFFLSSAGFLGAAIAIGGQHRVGDYLTGLAVLLEDRFGVGDEIEVSLGWDKPVRATVEHVGMITTRLRDGNSTFHIPHSKLDVVRNLSQEPVRESLQFDVASSLRRDLNVAGPLQAVQLLKRMLDADARSEQAMIAQHHRFAVAEVFHQAFAFFQAQRHTFIVVISQTRQWKQRLLRNRQQALFLRGHCNTRHRMGVHHAMRIVAHSMHRTVNGEARRVHIVGAVVHFLAIHVHLHQTTRRDFLEHEAVGVDQEMPIFIGHAR